MLLKLGTFSVILVLIANFIEGWCCKLIALLGELTIGGCSNNNNNNNIAEKWQFLTWLATS